MGEFDHHQKNRNGQRKNGIYYSSIGLLWRKFGKKYLTELKVKNVGKTFQYMDEAFINALKLADEFWNIYIKHAIAEVEAIDLILNKINESKGCFVSFDTEIPYKKAIKFYKGNKVKYIILKSRREGYEIRILKDKCKFKDELVKSVDIKDSRKITGIDELIYVDNNARL